MKWECERCGKSRTANGLDLCLAKFKYYETQTDVVVCGLCNHILYNHVFHTCAHDDHKAIRETAREFVKK